MEEEDDNSFDNSTSNSNNDNNTTDITTIDIDIKSYEVGDMILADDCGKNTMEEEDDNSFNNPTSNSNNCFYAITDGPQHGKADTNSYPRMWKRRSGLLKQKEDDNSFDNYIASKVWVGNSDA